ncbi:MAG: ABC transporter substrate-binding protein [Syntrophomonadaceae bacterium]|nr:ABC transporter substrate-binding protein [Syntrophomonadaceae bacterium]
MKRVMICIFAAVIGLGLTGCDRGATPVGVNQDEKKIITIGVMPDVESIPLIIADRNGYFEDEGVKVKIEHFKSASDRDSALQGGRLDGVITDVVAVVFSNEGGTDLRIISKNDGDIELMAGKESDIETIVDIKGKSVGLSSNTIMEYTADRMLESAGISADDVKKVMIPPLSTRLEMLQGGKIDAAILPQPLAGLGVKNGARVLARTSEVVGKAGAIAFTSESLRQNREEIKAVFRAYNRAVEYLKTEPASSYADYVVRVQAFPAGLEASLQLPAYEKASPPDPQVVADVVEWMKNRNLIQKAYEYSDLVDQEILREIQ